MNQHESLTSSQFHFEIKQIYIGRVFTTPDVSLKIPEGALFTDSVKRIKIDGCFHEYDYISLLKFEESRREKFKTQVQEATIANFAVLE